MIGKFTKKEVQGQLAKILISPKFSGASVLSEFLKFIVYETLENRGDALKEYTIGVSALKRDPDFNPQLDSSVRIHAGRLRRLLKEYYYEEGARDVILITVPKGSYAPVFLDHEVDHVAEQEGNRSAGVCEPEPPAFRAHQEPKAKLAVLPFTAIGASGKALNFARGFSEYLSTELTHFDEFIMSSYYSGNLAVGSSFAMDVIGLHLGADFVLTGSVESDDSTLCMLVQLNDCRYGKQLWAQTFEKSPDINAAQFRQDAINIIVASIAGISGAICKQKLDEIETGAPMMDESYLPLYWFSQFAFKFDKNSHRQAKQFYTKILKKNPQHALCLALLSKNLLGEAFLTCDSDGLIDTAIELARSSIRIKGGNLCGYEALAMAMLQKGELKEAVHTLEQGLMINPRSIDYQGLMGALLIYAGEFDKGLRILDKIIPLKPYVPWWQILGYSIYSYHRGYFADAIFWSNRIEAEVIWAFLIRAAAYGELNSLKDSRQMIADLKTHFPDVDLSNRMTLQKYFFADDFRAKLTKGLIKGGVKFRDTGIPVSK